VRYQFIEDHQEDWPIQRQCQVLQVTRSGYYAWQKRPISATAQKRAELTRQVQTVYAQNRRVYGAPRIHEELQASGHSCNRKTVAKVMKQAGLRSIMTRKFRVTTTDSNHPHPVADNIVNRHFDPEEPNRVWTADITYIPTQEGWLYLAAVKDLYSRKIVGWSMSDGMESRLVVDALQMAIRRELPGDGLVAHSDRGVQYASEHYQRILNQNQITCSMSRKGNCWDNAPMESFFSTLKRELVHHEDYHTRNQARQSLFEYIEVFYNRVRRHSALGYLSPVQFLQAS
jgi:transposase InsO family protein